MSVINLPQLITLFPQNTQVINVLELQDVVTGNYLNSAAVTATLYDDRGNADPTINALVLAYLPGSNGSYQGTVPFQFNAKIGDGYKLVVTANQAGVQSLYSFIANVTLRQSQ